MPLWVPDIDGDLVNLDAASFIVVETREVNLWLLAVYGNPELADPILHETTGKTEADWAQIEEKRHFYATLLGATEKNLNRRFESITRNNYE